MLRVLLRFCANLLWSALSSVARLGLHFVSADSSEREAQRVLLDEFKRIAMTEADMDAAKVRGSWQSNRLRLRTEMLRRDARGFLTWQVIRDTMFPPPYAAFARTELKFLKQHNWRAWQGVIRERAAGLPLPCLFYPLSSSNAIHQAYHLCRFEVETGVPVRDLASIVEFGGGYGSLCRIAHAAGFGGTYAIFDLPEQLALQRYYLRGVGVRHVKSISDISVLQNVADRLRGPRLLIATWSLSESPLELRKQVAAAVRGFDAFLIAYQSEFGGVDNGGFFREWQTWFTGVSWKSFAIEQVPPSTYLFGVRNR